jgi:hypothetical protein
MHITPTARKGQKRRSTCRRGNFFVEPFGKTHTDAGVGDNQKEFVTEQALALTFGSTPSLHLTNEDWDEPIIGASTARSSRLAA